MSPGRTLGRCLLVVELVSVRAVAAPDDNIPIFTRSLYLPVRFTSCVNLKDGTLYEDLEPVATLPSTRIYQFTYYSDKDRFVPDEYEVDLTVRDTIQPRILRASLTISLEGIWIGDRFIHRTFRKEVEAQLKRKRDARFEEAKVFIHCPEVEACQEPCLRFDGENGSPDHVNPSAVPTPSA